MEVIHWPGAAVQLANACQHGGATEELEGPYQAWIQERLDYWHAPERCLGQASDVSNLHYLLQQLQALAADSWPQWLEPLLEALRLEERLLARLGQGDDREPSVNQLLKAVRAGEQAALAACRPPVEAYLERSRRLLEAARPGLPSPLAEDYSAALGRLAGLVAEAQPDQADALQHEAATVGMLWDWDRDQRQALTDHCHRWSALPEAGAEWEMALSAAAGLPASEQATACAGFGRPLLARLLAAWQRLRPRALLLASPKQMQNLQARLQQAETLTPSASAWASWLDGLDLAFQELRADLASWPEEPDPYLEILQAIVSETLPDVALTDLMERQPLSPELEGLVQEYLDTGDFEPLREAARALCQGAPRSSI